MARAVAERLHDGPLQLLVAIQVKLKHLERDAEHGISTDRVAEIRRLTQSVVEDLNRTMRELWEPEVRAPQHGCDPKLFSQLMELCRDFRLQSGLKCRFAVLEEHICFDSFVTDIVCRAVRELLQNVRKHARATLVQVSSEISGDRESIVLHVEDDGLGLSDSDWRDGLESKGFGLWSIDQRLRQVGGTIELENHAGLRASLVLPRRLAVLR
jgi:signal transduction histidine kinase